MTTYSPGWPSSFRPLLISLCQLLFFFLLLNIGPPGIVLVTLLFTFHTFPDRLTHTQGFNNHWEDENSQTCISSSWPCSYLQNGHPNLDANTSISLPKLLHYRTDSSSQVRNLGMTEFLSFTRFLHPEGHQKLYRCYPCFLALLHCLIISCLYCFINFLKFPYLRLALL